MLTIDVITLFPNLFSAQLKHLPLKRALDEGLVSVNLHQLRDYAIDKRGTVDDKPYGGGVGMILMVEPIVKSLEAIPRVGKSRIVVMSPSGEKYTQKKATEYSMLDQIIILCGRYEGIDQRVINHFADEAISIGDYVLSGGEIPALAIIESVSRLVPGVIKKGEALAEESFVKQGLTEYPQYTRPEDFRGHKVPEVLLKGDHKKIKEWRKHHTSTSSQPFTSF